MENDSEIAEKSISERFGVLWDKMSRNQRRFVVAMQDCANKKEAAYAIGLEPDTVYRWPKFIDDAIILLGESVKETAAEILARNLAKAAMVKISGLDDDDARIRQSVATELLERGLGKVPSKSEISGPDGDELTINVRVSGVDE